MRVSPVYRKQIEGLTITMTDVVVAGHCASGARRWFHAHGLDFHAFMNAGINAVEFVEAGDDLARQVVDRKLERAAHHG